MRITPVSNSPLDSKALPVSARRAGAWPALWALLAAALLAGAAHAQAPQQQAQARCPDRPAPGSVVINEPTLESKNGVLSADFTMRDSYDQNGYIHYCYDYGDSKKEVESPTLRLNPGDQLDLSLTNRVANIITPPPAMDGMHMMMPPGEGDCTGGKVINTTTNIHFHGLNVPPICHQDDVLTTLIQATDPPFQYKITIPPNDPPGLYWYHPHPHGYATLQVNGGAAGALIINGMEKIRPEVAGLPERVFVIRQQFLNIVSWLPGPNQLTVNFQVAASPQLPAPIIEMKPNAKEFWRVANASTQAFLALQIWFVTEPQEMEIIAIDGVPVKTPMKVKTITIPPAGRAEFIMQGPPLGTEAYWQTIGYDTGPAGNPNAPQNLAKITVSNNTVEPAAMPMANGTTGPQRFADLADAAVTAQRKLFFSEATGGINGPTKYYITVDGQKPEVFNVNGPPKITTKVGAVEDWTIENRAEETHDFHIHQVHFLLMEINGKPVPEPYLADSVAIPYWSGTGPYPSIKVRIDFRDPNIAGTFVYHCHILDHEDGGMMAKILVQPN